MKQYTSLYAIHRVFWRHTFHYLSNLILQTILFILCGWLFLLLFSGLSGLSPAGINTVFILLSLGLLYSMIRLMVDWSKHGFSLRTFFHRLEEHHPEIANRASMLVYAEQDAVEIKRLGYSTELIAADDTWLSDYMTKQINQISGLPSASIIIALILISALWCGIYTVESNFVVSQHQHILQSLWVRGLSTHGFTLTVPETVTVARGNPLSISAALPEDNHIDEGFIHIVSNAGWRSYSAKVEDNQLRFQVPAVRQEITYYFSAGSVLSNPGKVIPLDPPLIQEAEIAVVPPEYTGIPSTVHPSLRPISVPEGSQVTILAKSSSSLTSASIQIGNEPHMLEVNTIENKSAFGVAFTVENDQSISFSMTDTNGLTSQSQIYPFIALKDATPSVDILNPNLHSTIPDELLQSVQVKVDDDYRIMQVLSHFWINDNKESTKHMMLWQYSPEAAKQAGSATSFFLNYQWDLAQNAIFPGDEISYYVEALDNDALHGSKAGKSDVHVIHYPSLSDLLSFIEEKEEEHIEELSGLVDKQNQIIKEMDETTNQIAEKLEDQAFQEEPQEGLWEEKKQLENLKNRQEELVEKAKELEQSLQQMEENITNSLPVEKQQEQGFSMETLEKMERVRELMKNLLDEDSQKMLETIENTVEKLSQDITPEDLEEMQFSVEDFKEQLDRTLSLLENNVMERQLDGLKQMAQDLAERQDHLEREAQQIMEEEQLLAQREAELNEQIQQNMEKQQNQEENLNNDDTENPQEQDSNKQDGNQSEDTKTGDENKSGDENKAGDENKPGETSSEEQNKSENAQDQNADSKQENQDGLTEEQKAQQQSLQQKKEELEARKQLLEERQQRLNDDTGKMMEKMDEMQEEMQETNPSIAQQLENMSQKAEQKGLMKQMQLAMQQMQKQNMQQAQSHQQEAEEQLREMAEEMQNQMMDLGMQAMQMDLSIITRLIERGLFLSDNLETITLSENEIDSQRAIHRAQAFTTETKRIQVEWETIASSNPFMSQTVTDLLIKSHAQLEKAVDSSKGVKWVAWHESRQSLIALNDALYAMLEDSQQMQQQMQQMMQQSQGDSIQQQLQQMLSEQQSLGEQMEQMRKLGEQGKPMLEQLQRMAEKQSMIRQKMEEMMQQYKNARQMRNQLQGIYEDMKDVENMLTNGENGEEVAAKQKQIETRLLEAGTFQEKDEYGKTRKAETAQKGLDAESPESLPDMPIEQRAENSILRPDDEQIPLPYREAIKNYYIKLNQSLKN